MRTLSLVSMNIFLMYTTNSMPAQAMMYQESKNIPISYDTSIFSPEQTFDVDSTGIVPIEVGIPHLYKKPDTEITSWLLEAKKAMDEKAYEQAATTLTDIQKYAEQFTLSSKNHRTLLALLFELYTNHTPQAFCASQICIQIINDAYFTDTKKEIALTLFIETFITNNNSNAQMQDNFFPPLLKTITETLQITQQAKITEQLLLIIKNTPNLAPCYRASTLCNLFSLYLYHLKDNCKAKELMDIINNEPAITHRAKTTMQRKLAESAKRALRQEITNSTTKATILKTTSVNHASPQSLQQENYHSADLAPDKYQLEQDLLQPIEFKKLIEMCKKICKAASTTNKGPYFFARIMAAGSEIVFYIEATKFNQYIFNDNKENDPLILTQCTKKLCHPVINKSIDDGSDVYCEIPIHLFSKKKIPVPLTACTVSYFRIDEDSSYPIYQCSLEDLLNDDPHNYGTQLFGVIKQAPLLNPNFSLPKNPELLQRLQKSVIEETHKPIIDGNQDHQATVEDYQKNSNEKS